MSFGMQEKCVTRVDSLKSAIRTTVAQGGGRAPRRRYPAVGAVELTRALREVQFV